MTAKNRSGQTAPVSVSPGNHDVSNAVGYYKAMSLPFDATSYVNRYNRSASPAGTLTNAGFLGGAPGYDPAGSSNAQSYSTYRVQFSRDLGGVHFVFVGMWPDSAARSWLEADLRKVSVSTPMVLFAHDQPDIETKHLMNSNWNQFYTYANPNGDISLSTFRVDSPMKGEPSASDPTKLSFQVIAVDPEARNMTVREHLWNTGTWGSPTTVPLAPRLN